MVGERVGGVQSESLRICAAGAAAESVAITGVGFAEVVAVGNVGVTWVVRG